MTNEKTAKIGLACFFCGKSIDTAKEVVRSEFYMNACDECYEKEHNRDYEENNHANLDDVALDETADLKKTPAGIRYVCNFCGEPASRTDHSNRFCDDCYKNTYGE